MEKSQIRVSGLESPITLYNQVDRKKEEERYKLKNEGTSSHKTAILPTSYGSIERGESESSYLFSKWKILSENPELYGEVLRLLGDLHVSGEYYYAGQDICLGYISTETEEVSKGFGKERISLPIVYYLRTVRDGIEIRYEGYNYLGENYLWKMYEQSVNVDHLILEWIKGNKVTERIKIAKEVKEELELRGGTKKVGNTTEKVAETDSNTKIELPLYKCDSPHYIRLRSYGRKFGWFNGMTVSKNRIALLQDGYLEMRYLVGVSEIFPREIEEVLDILANNNIYIDNSSVTEGKNEEMVMYVKEEGVYLYILIIGESEESYVYNKSIGKLTRN